MALWGGIAVVLVIWLEEVGGFMVPWLEFVGGPGVSFVALVSVLSFVLRGCEVPGRHHLPSLSVLCGLTKVGSSVGEVARVGLVAFGMVKVLDTAVVAVPWSLMGSLLVKVGALWIAHLLEVRLAKHAPPCRSAQSYWSIRTSSKGVVCGWLTLLSSPG